MKHFFPGIIAQDIRKAKSKNIELFKNALNKLLNHFIIIHMRTLLHAFHSNGLHLWRLAPSSDGKFNRTKSTMTIIMTTMTTFLNVKFRHIELCTMISLLIGHVDKK